MEIWDGVDPIELTAYARVLLEDRPQNQFLLEQWLPNTQIADLEFRIDKGIDRNYNGASPLRAFDTPVPLVARPGRTRITGELPPLGEMMRLSEYDRLRLNARGAEAIVDQIFNDTEVLLRRARNKLELMRGQALENAGYSFNENGIDIDVDFGRQNSLTVTAGTLWGAASPTPLTDELSWIETYIDINGTPPGAVLMSTAVRTALLQTDEYRSAGYNLSAAPAYLTVDAFNNVRASHDLPPVVIYDAKVGGSRIISANKIIFLPAQGEKMGDTFWGVTAESLEVEIDQTDQAGIVAYTLKGTNPVAVYTATAAIALPVMPNPDLTMVATVLA